MYGNAMYEVAKQRIAEQQRAAATGAAGARGAAKPCGPGARGRKARETIATPVIPDFAEEMFGPDRDAVPGARENKRGRPGLAGRVTEPAPATRAGVRDV